MKLRVFLALPAVALAIACGNSDPMGRAPLPASVPSPSELPPGPISCPAGGDLTVAADIVPGLLPGEAELETWEKYMVNLGPRFTGSPAHKKWHEFMVKELTKSGLSIVREPIPLEWWLHKKYSLKLIQNGVETEVPVASYYPYSGSTPEGGIVAGLTDAGIGLQFANAASKIAFYEEDMLPLTLALFYSTASYVHDPDGTMTPLTDFKRASVSFLTPQEQGQGSLALAKAAGAVGAIVSYEASYENAEGQYTPFLTNPGASQGVPALYVDRATGDMIKAKIAQGAQARLELVVEKHPGDFTEDIIATLPGMTDEVIIVNTHSDGTSAAQENGTLGVMALARYFASLPLSCRQKTMIFTLNPGHFHSGIGGDTDRFIKNYPEIIAKSVASVTLEHLGQTEWVDDVTGFHATGLFEPGVFYGSQNAMQLLMKNAVIAEDLRRVFVARPYGVIYFGVGSPLNARGVPNAAYITGPNMMLAFGQNQHLDKLDYSRMAAEIRTATRIAASMDATASTLLCAGMGTNSADPTGCTPPN